MRVKRIIWLPEIEDKLAAKHSVIVFFILKQSQEALILSARDMDDKEHRRYARRNS